MQGTSPLAHHQAPDAKGKQYREKLGFEAKGDISSVPWPLQAALRQDPAEPSMIHFSQPATTESESKKRESKFVEQNLPALPIPL